MVKRRIVGLTVKVKANDRWGVSGWTPDLKRYRKQFATRAEAETHRDTVLARWGVGLRAEQSPETSSLAGLDMDWDAFSDLYLADRPSKDNASRLSLAARILGAQTVGDVFHSLKRLQDGLRDGVCSRYQPPRPRSANTVHSHMRTVLAALEWGRRESLWSAIPSVNLDGGTPTAKGQALTAEQFRKMKTAAAKVLGKAAAVEWVAIMDCMANTGLRLAECHRLTWDEPTEIDPADPPIQVVIETRGGKRCGFLRFFPGSQKSGRVEDCPLAKWAVDQLDARKSKRGHVFDPQPREVAVRGRRRRTTARLSADAWGKTMSAIGQRAAVIVAPVTYRVGPTGKRFRIPAKYASAHDLRRTFGQRLVDARVPVALASAMLRHKDIRTTETFYARAKATTVGDQVNDLLEAAGVA